MKLLIASDLHGSAYYTKQLVERIEKENPDKIVLLGDILYHGPRNDLPKDYNPKQVIEILNPYANKILAVRGNCDSEVDQMVLDFPLMSDYLEFFDGSTQYLFTHGHLFESGKIPQVQKDTYVVFGHTHVPQFKEDKGVYYINPGSISIPKENSKHSYIIIQDNMVAFKDLQGQVYVCENK